MIKNITLFAAALVLSLFAFALPSTASTLQEIAASTVKVYFVSVDDKGMQQTGTCTAEFVRKNFLVTAGHCAPNVDAVKVAFFTVSKLDDQDNEIYTQVFNLKIVGGDRMNDLLLLQVLDPAVLPSTFKPLDIAASDAGVQFATPLITIGYPLSGPETFTSGTLVIKEHLAEGEAAPNTFKDGYAYRTTIPVDEGNSGGGLWLEVTPGNYQMIGLCSFKLMPQAGAVQPSISSSWFSTLLALQNLISHIDSSN